MRLFQVFFMPICAVILAQDIQGNWLSYSNQGKQYFEIRYSDWNRTTLQSEQFKFGNIKDNNDFRHELKQDIGIIVFTGIFKNGNGVGEFSFTINQNFKEYLESNNIKVNKESDFLVFLSHGLTKDQIEYFNKKYGPLTAKDLKNLCIFRITEDFDKEITGSGLKVKTLKDLKKLSIHDIDTDYIKSVRREDKNVKLKDVVKYKIHNLDFAEFKKIKSLGYSDLELEKYLKLKIHGISYDNIKRINDDYNEIVNINKIIKMKIHGVDSDFIRNMKRAFKKNN
jgi:hypothetical protein